MTPFWNFVQKGLIEESTVVENGVYFAMYIHLFDCNVVGRNILADRENGQSYSTGRVCMSLCYGSAIKRIDLDYGLRAITEKISSLFD